MPELPEVEVVRRGLADHVTGRRICAVEVLHPRAVRRQAGSLADALAGRTIDAAGEPVRIDKAFSWEAPMALHGMR